MNNITRYRQETLLRWMKGRCIINPTTFESEIRVGGKTIPVDQITGEDHNNYLWIALKEELWEECQQPRK